MVRKIQAKLVLRLHGQGLSGRAIARSQGMSRRSVADVLDAAKAAGIGWDDVASRPDDEVYALLFPGRGERESVYEQITSEFLRVPEARRIPVVGVRIGGETAADHVAADALRGGGLGIRPQGAGQQPRRVCAQLVFRPVRVHRFHGGPADRREHARGLAWEHAVVLAPAPAGDGIQPVLHE